MRADAASGGPPPIELTGEALDAPQSITPVAVGEEVGAYRVMFGKLPEGRYRAKVVGSAENDSAAHAVFDVRSNVDELLHLEAKQALMARLATLSGGARTKDGHAPGGGQTAGVAPGEIAARADSPDPRLGPLVGIGRNSGNLVYDLGRAEEQRTRLDWRAEASRWFGQSFKVTKVDR